VVKTEAGYGSQSESSLYSFNWYVFGTLQVRLLNQCQAKIVCRD